MQSFLIERDRVDYAQLWGFYYHHTKIFVFRGVGRALWSLAPTACLWVINSVDKFTEYLLYHWIMRPNLYVYKLYAVFSCAHFFPNLSRDPANASQKSSLLQNPLFPPCFTFMSPVLLLVYNPLRQYLRIIIHLDSFKTVSVLRLSCRGGLLLLSFG